jgi:hypothetical protein
MIDWQIKRPFDSQVENLIAGPWTTVQKALVVHLVESFPLLTWSVHQYLSMAYRNGPKLIIAFDQIGSIGGRIELYRDDIELWTNGERVGIVEWEEPHAIDKVEEFVQTSKLRKWDPAALRD